MRNDTDDNLQISPRRRLCGWSLIGLGLILLAVPLWLYLRQPAPTRPEVQAPASVTTQPAVSPEQAKARALGLFWVTVLILLGLFGTVVFLIAARRFAMRYRQIADVKPSETPFYDPWAESGRRVKVPPDDDLDQPSDPRDD